MLQWLDSRDAHAIVPGGRHTQIDVGSVMARMDERLRFTTIACDRCGSVRVLENACGDCGRRPRKGEVNAPVVRRRERMRKIESEIARRTGEQFGFDPSTADTTLVDLMNAFVRALSGVLASGADSDAASDLVDTVLGLRSITADLKAASALRPSARPRAYLAVASELQQLWPTYLLALTTSDVAAAERLAAAGQNILDGVARHLNDLATDLKGVELLADLRREPELARRIFDALRLKHPGMDFDALMEQGRIGYRVASGQEQEVARGSAVDFLTVQLVANAYLDPSALALKLRELASAPIRLSRLRTIASMTDAIDDFGVARRDLFEALTQFAQIADRATDVAVLIRRLAKTVGELYEAALPFFAWFKLLLGSSENVDAYERTVVRDSTELATQLSRTLPATFRDFPTFLRNAGHHGRAFHVDADAGTVTIRLRSHSESMTVAEYVDRAYALLESLLAVQWTISNWLERSTIAVPMPSGAADTMGLTQQSLAALWLAEVRGTHVDQSTLVDGRWIIAGDLDSGEVFHVAIAVAQHADQRCQVVEVRGSGATNAPLSLSLHDYERFAAASRNDGGASTLGLLELRHRTTSPEGECLLMASDAEFSVVTMAFAVLNGELDQVSNLRRARQLATSHGHTDLAALATRALSTIRNGDDFNLKRDLAARTGTLTIPQMPTASAVEVRLNGDISSMTRSCDENRRAAPTLTKHAQSAGARLQVVPAKALVNREQPDAFGLR